HFDIILNIDGFNEIALAPNHNAPQGINVYYPYNWSIVCNSLTDLEGQRHIGEIVYLGERRQAQARLFAQRLLRYSPTAQLVWKALDHRCELSIAKKRGLLQQHPWKAMSYAMAGAPTTFESD